jgi:ankyrin repeat protein
VINEVDNISILCNNRQHDPKCDEKSKSIIDSDTFTVDYQCLDFQMSALHDACQEGRLPVVIHLIKKGANLELINCHGNTAFLSACLSKFDNIELLQILVSAGADITAVNSKGECAVLMAA